MEPHFTHFPARRDLLPFPHNLFNIKDHPRNLRLYALYYALAPYSPLHAMTGPVRSTTTAKTRPKDVQPPRPPNAWILYRSDKLKSLPPEQPGAQRRAQADVSKLISEMWRSESEAVKLEYERLADAKKAEHQRLYPSYRFQPMKKEEKERLREEKRQEKERVRAQKKGRGRTNAAAGPSQEPPPHMPPMGFAAPYLLPSAMSMPIHMPHPQYMVYNPEVQFGPAGPSPPLSAASSPNDTTSASESPSGLDELLMQPSAVPSARASPIPDAQYQLSQQLPDDVVLPSSFQQSLLLQPEKTYSTQPMASQQSQTAQPQWQPSQEHILPQPSGLGPAHQPSEWDDFNSSQAPFDFHHPEFLNLDIPLANNGDLPALTYEGLQALLSSTSTNGVYNMENINPAELAAHPQGELEIAMAPQPDAQSLDLGDLFNDFDFGADFATQETESGAVNPLDTVVQPTSFNDFASLFQTPNNPELQAYQAAQQRQRQPSAFTREMLDFINFEAAEGGLQNAPAPQVRPPPPPPTPSTQMPIFTQMTNTPAVAHSGYVPPAGAANSSTRRVAASWKPSFAVHDDSPVDPVQTQWIIPTAQ
ncbi:hypothetical protein K503DRAFT_799226 [Rhizopogon vinicolor AM-OR11-026]|uniref:HMG box domain-containing protein n=1 Tax=Rhizopogon vinicolor AM-OR11-026 TaxID=1314800 RepID=A0A1B7N523_9AGAM|nr:hypothetical protein K503DRAFT_799226 [Rhizopogon vinicolor AM-OR11-026]